MGNNGGYPGRMPPYQQPYPPYQQSYQQQGCRQPQPRAGPPSPIIPQPAIINADGRLRQQALPTRMQVPYTSGGLPTEPSPEYYFHPEVTYIAPLQPQVYLNSSSSLATQVSYANSHLGSSYSDVSIDINPRAKPRGVSPTSTVPVEAPDPPSIHPFPKRDPYSPKHGSQAGHPPVPKAASHHHHRSRSHTRTHPTHHRSSSELPLKSILKQPSPQHKPDPEPKPKSKHHHRHHHHRHHHNTPQKPMPITNPHNPLAPALTTEHDILLRGLTELGPLTRPILEVITYEFALPAHNTANISFSLTAIDIVPPSPNLPATHAANLQWDLGPGILHGLTHARVLAPLLTITLPPRYQPATALRASLPEPIVPGPQPDHGVIAACERVVAALRYGGTGPNPAPVPAVPDPSTQHQPERISLPFRVGGELSGSNYTFRIGAADETTILGAETWVYLPSAERRDLGVPVYERVKKDGREGRRKVGRWAGEWGVRGELGVLIDGE
ncbi:uncharacterized protein GGS22DRAFT_171885 [Annulohypoxylon maeteangense]|uniref:uncharacterized protein n=1 Tax=Annulohypoxylon maeteangense TaxID=1927788 RepID=UPI002008A464|nr:uncharacterized protein GGS22DRAFT_171885 [Annulohypoxylon maeteangense]KAI0881792.1 hypothetical protein GGS22DRAFT_171885 [Annulohypoxylon maeteangense]